MEPNSRPKTFLSIKPHGAEYYILIAALIILGFGLLQSLVFANSANLSNSPTEFFETLKIFVIALIVGSALALFGRSLNPNWLFFIGFALFIGSCFLLFYTSTHGILAGNARRWILVWGFMFQPVELFKISVVLSFAGVLSLGFQKKKSGLFSALLWIILLAGLGAGLILVFMQPDRSSAIMVFLVITVMALMSRVNRILLWSVVLIVIIFGIVFSYQNLEVLNRVTGKDKYQIERALEAIAGGGLFPTNIGESVAKYSIHAASNDFIFAIIIEQFGFFIGVGLLFTYAYLFLYALKVSQDETNPYLRMMGVGATMILLINMSVHIAVNLNLIMTTGVSLPFISKGGSALMLNLMALGLILNVARRYDLKSDSNL